MGNGQWFIDVIVRLPIITLLCTIMSMALSSVYRSALLYRHQAKVDNIKVASMDVCLDAESIMMIVDDDIVVSSAVLLVLSARFIGGSAAFTDDQLVRNRRVSFIIILVD